MVRLKDRAASREALRVDASPNKPSPTAYSRASAGPGAGSHSEVMRGVLALAQGLEPGTGRQ